jgi:uncharacterized protein (DUF2336 family)
LSKPLPLTAADAHRLIEEPSPVVRAQTAVRVADTISTTDLTERERAIAREILAAFARDAEIRVRQALADSVKDHPDLPAEIAEKLARDVIEVAVPVLEHSAVLSDETLLAIVYSESAAHQTAIARRPRVSETLSEALVERGDEKTVATVLGNQGASIADKSLHRALDRFGANAEVNESLVGRRQLPLTVTERLVTLVSEHLREQLVTRHELPPDVAADLLLEAREKALLGALGPGADPADVSVLVRTLNQNSRLTRTLILRALLSGDIDFFETALAELAQIPVANAHILIWDAGRHGLEALAERCLVPKATLPLVRAALGVIAETDYDERPADRARFVERVIERILTQFEVPLGLNEIDWLIRRHARAQQAAHAASASLETMRPH